MYFLFPGQILNGGRGIKILERQVLSMEWSIVVGWWQQLESWRLWSRSCLNYFTLELLTSLRLSVLFLYNLGKWLLQMIIVRVKYGWVYSVTQHSVWLIGETQLNDMIM